MRKIDTIFKWVCLGCAAAAGILLFSFFLQLILASSGAWQTFGINFLFSTEWNPATDQYGALPSIAGTLITTGIALVIALVVAFAAAL